MKEITFEDVKEKYNKVSHYLEINNQLCFGKHPEKHWIDGGILAEWLYEASKEWLKEYKDFATKYFSQAGNAPIGKIEGISHCGANLIDKVESFRVKINSEFGLEL